VIDPVTRHVHQFQKQSQGRMLKETEILTGEPLLPGLTIPVSNLFRPPTWLAPKAIEFIS
jgi:Uma2 family endonuclease